MAASFAPGVEFLSPVARPSKILCVSARDVQFENSQWVRGKTFDTFCPRGPWVVTADELGNPQSFVTAANGDYSHNPQFLR